MAVATPNIVLPVSPLTNEMPKRYVVRNNSATALAGGQFVYIAGWNEVNKIYNVALAGANVANGAAEYFIPESIGATSNGYAVDEHRLDGVDTSAGAVGDPVYLSTTAGTWTLTAPTGTSIVQKIGRIAVASANGSIQLDMAAQYASELSGQAFIVNGNSSVAISAANSTVVLATGGSTRWTWAAASSNVTLAGAADIIGAANVASMVRITDGTTAILAVDSRNTVTGVATLTITPPAAISIVSAAGTTYSAVSLPANTITLTGGVLVTALAGLVLNIASPTVTSAAATTVTTASSVILNGPLPAGAGGVTFTNSVALDIPTYATNGTTASALRIAAPTGAAANYAINVTSGVTIVPDGTAAAPTLRMTGSNTGVYRETSAPGTDGVGFSVAGARVASLQSNAATAMFLDFRPAAGQDFTIRTTGNTTGRTIVMGGDGTASGVHLRMNSSGSAGTGVIDFSNGADTGLMSLSANGTLTITPIAVAAGVSSLVLTPGAHTAVIAEVIDVSLVAHTMTVTGNYATQRSVVIASPTVTSVAAQTITTMITAQINGPLPAGSAVFTNSVALDIPTYVTNGTTASGLRVAAPSGATTNNAITVVSGNLSFGAAASILTTVGALTLAPVSGSNLALTVAGAGNLAISLGTGTVTLSANGILQAASGVIALSVTNAAIIIGTAGTLVGPVVAGALTDATAGNVSGAMGYDSTDGRWYFRSAAWHYVTQTAGFVLPKHSDRPVTLNAVQGYYDAERDSFDETLCPLCHTRIQIGQYVTGRIDSHQADGSLHGYYTHLHCALRDSGGVRPPEYAYM